MRTDPNALLRRPVSTLRRQPWNAGFPGAIVWYGRETGRWWALLPVDEWRHLIEATTPEHLAPAIGAARSCMATMKTNPEMAAAGSATPDWP